jgi:hypothetical protein
MKLLFTIVALTLSFGALAQAPSCAQAQDPKACQERVDRMKALRAEVEKACEGTRGAERSGCMQKQMCAHSANPAACAERIGRLNDAHARARQACEGKKGDEARACMRTEMCAQSKDPAK